MRKSQSNSKRLSAAVLSAVLLISTCNPGVCQTASGEPAKDTQTAPDLKSTDVKPTSPNTTNPEADARSAGNTVSAIDSKVEQKVDQGLDNPQADPKTGEDLLNSLKEKVAVPSTQIAPAGIQPATDTTKTPTANTVTPSSVLSNPGATKTVAPSTSTTTATTKPAFPPAKDKPTEVAGTGILTGRIEQISGEGEVKMPVLKAQTAVLDTRGKLLPGEVEKYSGTVAKSFPTDFRGIWGGTLQIWSYRYSPDYLAVDREEAISTAKLLKPKRSGVVNFNFYNDRFNQVALQPATVLLSVPISETNTFSQMTSGSGGMGAFSGMFSQMMGNMEAPVINIHFGTYTTNSAERGVSGNDWKQDVAKNVIRMLGPGVLEQQIVTKYTTRTPAGKTSSGYDESVMRFKKLDNNKLYVLCAAVKYSHTGKYLSKLIMYGTVDRNRRMDTNPMGGMNSMMGAGGMGGMDMQKMMNGMMGGSGSGPIQVPHGGFQNMPGMGGMTIPGGSGGAGSAGGLNELMKQLNQQLQNQSR